MSKSIQEVLERYFAAIRAHDWDSLAETLAEEIGRASCRERVYVLV